MRAANFVNRVVCKLENQFTEYHIAHEWFLRNNQINQQLKTRGCVYVGKPADRRGNVRLNHI